jgi:hypothetical protein
VQSCESREAETGHIEGTVTDYETAQAIPYVTVTVKLTGRDYQTGNDGKFFFKDIKAGGYTLLFSHSNYSENNGYVDVIKDQTVTRDITLTKNVLSLSPTSLDFGANETEKSVTLTHSSGGTIYYNLTSDYSWIIIENTSGTITSGTKFITVKVLRTELYAGNYTGNMTINYNGGSIIIPVNISVGDVSTPATVTIPEVLTDQVIGVTLSAAQVSATLTSLGGATTVTDYGHCWSTSPNPATSNDKTTFGSTNVTQSFTSNLTGLSANTIYYVRAYAVNSAGTGYGDQIYFTTNSNITIPVVSTGIYPDIWSNSATVYGTVSDDGGSGVTQRGICYSIFPNPNINNSSSINEGSGTGNFSCYMSGLFFNTTYYVKAYATNSAGTAYGDQISFTTEKNITKPTVSTGNYPDVWSNSATVYVTVSDDGGSEVTQRGVCYSTSPSPNMNDYVINDGGGTGSFACYLTRLSHLTTYYVRSYAINSAGTEYGNQISFTTPQYQPAATYSSYPSIDTYTYCWGEDYIYGSCSDEPNRPNNISMAVTSITSSTITFRMEKCSGKFTHSGTFYLKEGSVCGTNLYSTNYKVDWWYIDNIEVPNDLWIGDEKTYYAVIISATNDRYYAGPITIIYQ